ncbi:hypothetical protein CEXT_228321, partial [Caerostris extrusa]
ESEVHVIFVSKVIMLIYKLHEKRFKCKAEPSLVRRSFQTMIAPPSITFPAEEESVEWLTLVPEALPVPPFNEISTLKASFPMKSNRSGLLHRFQKALHSSFL